MISHEDLIAPLSVSNKPSIEATPQLLIKSENIPIVATPTSPDLPTEKQCTDAVCVSSHKISPPEADSQKSLSLSSNVQSLNIDMESSKISHTCTDNCLTSPRVVSPPMLSEPFPDSFQGSSIRENDSKNASIHEGISTPSPPYVPINTSESQIKQSNSELINQSSFQDNNVKINNYENQTTPVYYQNGYLGSNNLQDNFTKNAQYYGNPMLGTPLYSQYPQPNAQLYPSSQNTQSYFLMKQQKNSKIPKTPYQPMYIWNPQQPNQHQIASYQYCRYPSPQMQKQMTPTNFNVYNNYPHFSPIKNEIPSYSQQSFNGSINLKQNIYDARQLNVYQFSPNPSMPHLPYQLPNQDQQHYLNSMVDDKNNNLNSWTSINHDPSSNYPLLQEENPQHPTPQAEVLFPQTQVPKTKSSSKSSKNSLKMHSIHAHHHQTPNAELSPPKPIYYNDKSLGRYGIRCVCGKGNITITADPINSTSSTLNSTKKTRNSKKNRNKSSEKPVHQEIIEKSEVENEVETETETPTEIEAVTEESGNHALPNSIKSNTLLIQCDICHFWLHGLCVNVARIEKDDSYVCPFCQNKQIFCTKCGENMNYSDPLIRCTKCGYWVHKECEGLIFGINPSDFVCRNCGGLGEEAVYEIPNVHFLNMPQHQKKIKPNDISSLLNNNNNDADNDKNDDDQKDESDIDLDTFFEMEIPDKTVFTLPEGNKDDKSPTDILEAIPDGLFKKMIMYDLNKSELEYRPTIEKYFHTFAPLLFDYSHEFWRVFKDTLSSILQCDQQVILNSIDSLANHLIYMPTRHLSIYNTFDDQQIDDNKIFYQSPKTAKKLFTNSESITKYLDNINMTRLEKQPTPTPFYCDKNDGRVYSTSSLDENAFIADITGFLMHTDEVRVEEEGIPKTCFLVTDMDLIIDTKGTDFEFFAPRIRRSFHFNTVVKLVRIQGEIRLCLFAMKMKTLLSSEEKMKKGPAIQAGGEIILPLDGTIPYPVNKVQWKDKKKHQKPASNDNDKLNSESSLNGSENTNSKGKKDDSDADNENGNIPIHTKSSNQSAIMTRNQERKKKMEMKLEKKNRDEQISKLTLLSSFYDDSVETFPFILLDDDEAVEKYKSQMEMKASKSKYGKGKK